MPERDGYIPGVPCWVDTEQPDAAAAADFYHRLFGWEVEDAMPPGADGHYFIGRIRGGDVAAIASQTPETRASRWNTYVWVDDVDASAAVVKDAGGTVLAGPFDVMDAGRMAVVSDTEGAALCLWQARQHRGARVVNEHGSLNFNGLRTRDVEAAKAFYGAVFGWKALDLPSGLMWALPGYGDHLEELTPGVREQMTRMGAPDGFIDVVAAIEKIATDDTSTPVHWNVTFAVDDAQATAERAAELGAEIVSGPTDAPWTKVVTIRDPAGAEFVAGQFVPENSGLTA